MAEITEKILSKKSKIQTTLFDINKEISVIIKFVNRLKIHSAEIVENLNSATSPALYLKKFVDVNSCLLKYLSLLTEISCKFEVLEISEKGLSNLTIPSDSNTNSNKQTVNNEKVNSKATKPNSVTTKSKKADERISSEKSSTESSSSVNEKSQNNKKNSKKNSPKLTNLKPENVQSPETKPKKSKGKKKSQSDTSKSVSSSSSTSSGSTGSHMKLPIDTIKEFCVWETEASETSSGETGSSSKAGSMGYPCRSATISPCGKVQIQQGKSSLSDVPVAEVVPTKVNESDSKPRIDDNCLEDIKCEKIKVSEPSKVNEMKNEVDEIKSINIPRKEGDEYEIILEHIQSPSEFYVYIDNGQEDSINELVRELKKIFPNKNNVWDNKNKKKNKHSLSKQLGSYVLYYSQCDEIWCRAKVINWGLNYQDNFIKIFLLDYGEYKSVSIDDIELMPDYLKTYPVFLCRCHLYGVLPLVVDNDSEVLSWGKGPTEKMKSLTEVAKTLKIKVAPEDGIHPSCSLPVTLWITDENTKSVNELLVNSKYAIYQPYCDMRALMSDAKVEGNAEGTQVEGYTENAEVKVKDLLDNWNPMRQDFESYENTYDLKIDDPAMYIYGYVGKDYERICMNYAKTGFCYKGQSCRKEHKKLDYLGFTTDQEEVYNNAFSDLNVPPVNTTAAVQVTCLLDVNIFCCVLDNHTWSSEEETLQSLLKFMNSPENVQSMKKLLIPPSTGQIVIAQYSQDKSWYRAKILDSQPENDTYTILFVDYGNKEDVSLRHIRAIEARYLHLPFQAVKCFIFGIEWNPEVPKQDVMDYMDKKITDEHLSIEIVSKFPGECTSVLANVFDRNGQNIGEDLLAQNYVIPKKEMIVSGDSVSMPG